MSVPSVKSSWISCVAISALALVLVVPHGAEAAKKKKARPAEELTNYLLGLDLSQWLVGAISFLATDKEIAGYLALTSDGEARTFIDEFWAARRTRQSVWPAKQPQGVFETRAREADTLYSEGPRPGRRSARGTVHILFGPAQDVRYEVSSRPNSPAVEVWEYPKDAEPGMHGEKPKRYYYFAREGEYTVETNAPQRQRLRRP